MVGSSRVRPLLIWAIGSSFTNFLGGGDTLIDAIRQRYPGAPEIVYKKMAGGAEMKPCGQETARRCEQRVGRVRRGVVECTPRRLGGVAITFN
jgi:hypothetical protein